MQFLVIAHDGTDADALQRRMSVREEHFVSARAARKQGAILIGGALLDGDKMVGSALIVEAEDRAALDAFLAADPYSKGNVWQRFEIMPMRVANLDS